MQDLVNLWTEKLLKDIKTTDIIWNDRPAVIKFVIEQTVNKMCDKYKLEL